MAALGFGIAHAAVPEVGSRLGVPVARDNRGGHSEVHARLVQRGYVQFHPALAALVGGFKPGLMLGHALYWTRSWLREHPERGGWFWKTATEWRDATGLTPREQESARNDLRNSGVWQEQLAGAPARLYFRLDLAVLAEKVGLAGTGEDDAARWERLAYPLGAPVLYFKSLADLGGGVAAGLVLSHLLGTLRSATLHRQLDPHGFIPANVEEARIALGLGTKVQRNAREALKRAGFVQEAWTQEQRPRLMVRLNLEAILACLSGQAEPQRRGRKTEPRIRAVEPVPVQRSISLDRACVVGTEGNVTRVVRLLESGPKSASAPAQLKRLLQGAGDERLVRVGQDDGGFRHARVAVLSKQQALGNAKGCPFVETRPAVLSKLYIQNLHTKPPTARAREEATAVDNAGCWRSRTMVLPFEEGPASSPTEPAAAPAPVCSAAATTLVVPEKLDRALHDSALRIVGTAPAEVQQDLLDELAGHLGMPRKTIDNPLGWLSKLAQRAQHGSLVLTMAPVIAAARARRQKAAERLPAHAPTACVPAAPDPEAAERAEQARARLRELRNGMAAKAAATARLRMADSVPWDQNHPTGASSPLGQIVSTDDRRPLRQIVQPNESRQQVAQPDESCALRQIVPTDDGRPLGQIVQPVGEESSPPDKSPRASR